MYINFSLMKDMSWVETGVHIKLRKEGQQGAAAGPGTWPAGLGHGEPTLHLFPAAYGDLGQAHRLSKLGCEG